MLVIHGHPASTCTTKILVVVHHLGLVEGKDFEIKSVTDFAVVKSPEWIAHQPFGQMPWFEDTEAGVELYESRAVARYIAAKYNSPLLPLPTSDPKSLATYGHFERAAANEVAQFDPIAGILAYQTAFAKMHGQDSDQGIIDAQTIKLQSKLEAYEKILSKHSFLAGDNLTLADLFHLPYGSLISKTGVAPALTDGSLPNVTRWWAALQALPEWQKVRDGGFQF